MPASDSPIAANLDPDERLIWTGQPKQGLRFQPQDIFMIPFSLMWGGFAIFWEASVLGLTGTTKHLPAGGVPIFMSLWGIPFVLIGLYMIFGRFFGDALIRKQTYYAVTNRRVIILKKLLTFSLMSFDLESTNNLNLNERQDGSGDILFGTPGTMQGLAPNSWPAGRGYRAPGFYLLPKAREIFGLIRDAQNASRRAGPR